MTEPTNEQIAETVLAMTGIREEDLPADDLADARNDARTAILNERTT